MMQSKDTPLVYIEIQGRRKTILYYLYNTLCILTCGILYILCKHSYIKIYITTRKSKLKYADCVALKNRNGTLEMIDVTFYKCDKLIDLGRYALNGVIKVIDTEVSRFIFDWMTEKYVLYPHKADIRKSFSELYLSSLDKSVDTEKIELYEKEIVYGLNVYNIQILTICEIIIKSTFSIENFVNVFCIVLWYSIGYITYATVIGLMLLYWYVEEIYSGVVQMYASRALQKKQQVRVFRNGKFISVDSSYIFPGDMIYIEPSSEFPCDAIIVKGDAIADESFLTGESVPICKSSSQRSVMYAGTAILRSVDNSVEALNPKFESLYRVKNLIKKDTTQQTVSSNRKLFEDRAIGLVVSTGYKTVRGQIMKEITNARPVYIAFLQEAYVFMYYMLGCGIVLGCMMSWYFRIVLSWTWINNMAYTADLLFALVSPALYASLTVGIQLSSDRLKKEGIKCNDKNRIYTTAYITTAVFDKTGTLTSDGMELLCIDNCISSFDKLENINIWTRIGISTCHSVYELDGKYSGDSLDIQMLMFSKCVMKITPENVRQITLGTCTEISGPFLKEYGDESEMVFYKTNDQAVAKNNSNLQNDTGKVIDILKTYDFTSDYKRMSVIVQILGKNYLFCKGSPDTILKMLVDTPENYHEKVKESSLCGYRVIAMGYREIDKITTRSEDEKNLKFLGLIIFANKLKPETPGVIHELKNANIRSAICTGDNILTAISVGRDCGIIDELTTVIFPVVNDTCKSVYDVEWVCLGDEDLMFDKVRLMLYKNNFDTYCNDFVVACEGKEYEFFKKTNYFGFLLEKGLIFARFSPGQKKLLVDDLRNAGHTTLFCGDGANDTAAISSAHVGVALAKNEASLASSFNTKDLSSVPILINECRNAMVTSAARFKYVSMSCIITYACLAFPVLRNLFLSDRQALVLDIFIIMPLTYFLSNFARNKYISKVQPEVSFFDTKGIVPYFISMLAQICILGCLSLAGDASTFITEKSKATTLVFYVACFQLIFNCLYYSDCTPYRESIIENRVMYRMTCVYSGLILSLLVANVFCFNFIDTTFFFKHFLFVELTLLDGFTILFCIALSAFACFLLPWYTRRLIINNRKNEY